MLNLNIWCTSVRSRGIIVAVQVGAVKIYVTAMEMLWQKERQGETQEPSILEC